MPALMLTTDLMFGSRVTSAASAAGDGVTMVGSPRILCERAREDAPRLIILDLTAAGCDPAELVPQLRSLDPAPRIVAYAPHVRENLLAAAAAAGCDEVLTRGQFSSRYEAILREHLSS